MNDEASSSAASAQQYDGQAQPEAAPTAAELVEKRRKNRQMFNKKRGELLGDLLNSLDILIYAELSTIYYMDCSFLRFLFRAMVQFMFLTPKQPPLPEHPPDKPIIGALLGSNALCLFLHIWLSAPSAGEATRGYLHGGLAMDFIGQQGPTSKAHLLLLDLLLLFLQITHLAANMVRDRLREATASNTSTVHSAQLPPPATSALRQDHDAEERGVHRSEEQQDIEMQTLNPTGTALDVTPAATTSITTSDPPSDHDTLLSSTTPRTDAHIFEAFHSGQIVVADLDLWKRLKEQFQLVKSYQPADPNSTAVQTLRTELAQRFLRMRNGTDAIRQTL
ncbi:hypothetical protein LTR37_007671 [Vermiconidia calcicola]|uniref:Uncharacterized protein n=1 Tax=Vermiconidia calcicola TaxID=1690605 RepID=A0ACC3NCU7_9PEZI|nr:hypothetical protein LTR37_007671 [Vermiconidia calcicola]